MTKEKWRRSFVISVVVSVVAPFFTFTASVATVEPLIAPSDVQRLHGMSSEEVEAYLNSSRGTRKISGMEKLLFPFTVPGAWRFYVRGVVTTFIIAFISCVAVTLWIAKSEGLA